MLPLPIVDRSNLGSWPRAHGLFVLAILLGATPIAVAQTAYPGAEQEADNGWDVQIGDEDWDLGGLKFQIGGDEEEPVPDSVLAPLPPIYGDFTASMQAAPGADAAPRPNIPLPDTDEDPFELEDLAPKKVYAQVLVVAGKGPDEQVAKILLDEGKAKYAAKDYKGAGKKFIAAAKRWPDSLLEEDALFYAAECQFFSDDYPEAYPTYYTLLKKYSYTDHLDVVMQRMFMIGQYWDKLAEKSRVPLDVNPIDSSRPLFDAGGHAIKAYQAVRLYDPTGRLADDSLMASGLVWYRDEHFVEAALDFKMLRETYPDSPHLLNAHLLEIEARRRTYQGPMYDSSPLAKAQEVAENTLVQFNTELTPEQRTALIKKRRELIELQAERDWTIARFYEKKNEFRGARYHYNQLIKDFPDSLAADRARTRLDEIRGEPDAPTDHFEWLSDLIDREDSVLR